MMRNRVVNVLIGAQKDQIRNANAKNIIKPLNGRVKKIRKSLSYAIIEVKK
jgi:hypothetical protein